jgi:tetratricopeptide (TPR) repeat protein
MEAFLVRRRGANAEAEGLYRSILGTYPNAMEAWLDLGEVLFHANPLRGRSFTESKDVLYRVVEFDPDHSTALIHLARIAAFERDLAELDSLVERFIALDPAPSRRMELDALQAFAHGDEARIDATIRRLAGAEDQGVALATWAAGVYARDLSGAERMARLLVAPHRSPEARRLGYAWLAHIWLAMGQWSTAREHLASLRELSEGMALEYRALLCALPFLPSDGCDPVALEADLEALDPGTIPGSENPSIVFTAHDPLHPLIRHYLLGLTRARLGDASGAERSASALLEVELPRTAGSLGDDLARSVRARSLIAESRESEALTRLEQARMETWYGQTLASPLYSRVLERYTRAELLRDLGRAEEALSWYANLVETSPFELAYLAMSHLRQAEIHEEAGERERATEHYARFVKLWSSADPELQPIVERARSRLDSLTGQRSGRVATGASGR